MIDRGQRSMINTRCSHRFTRYCWSSRIIKKSCRQIRARSGPCAEFLLSPGSFICNESHKRVKSCNKLLGVRILWNSVEQQSRKIMTIFIHTDYSTSKYCTCRIHTVPRVLEYVHREYVVIPSSQSQSISTTCS
jgi:hypothetical protein